MFGMKRRAKEAEEERRELWAKVKEPIPLKTFYVDGVSVQANGWYVGNSGSLHFYVSRRIPVPCSYGVTFLSDNTDIRVFAPFEWKTVEVESE